MSNNTKNTGAGKGSKPRPVDINKYSKNYDDIKWSKRSKKIKEER